MPITFEYRDSIFWIGFSGALSSKDLMDYMKAFGDEEDRLAVTPHRIADLTALAEITIGFDDILSLAKGRRVKKFPNAFKSAIVANTEVQTGFARMFQTLNNNPQIAIKIFPDRESALAWISA